MDSTTQRDKRSFLRGRWAVVVALAAGLVAAWAAGAPWSGSGSVVASGSGSVAAAKGPGRLFSANGIWNHPLAPHSRIDPHSAQLVSSLVRDVKNGVPWIGTDTYSTPLYRAGPNQRRVRVALDNPNQAGRTSLQRAFNSVPIPPHAHPAGGSDRAMTVWQPSKDMLWEFWRARKQSGRWHATWGGAMKHVSQNPGYYTPKAWPGLAQLNWGTSASSLSVIGGTMLIRELRAGHIRHGLAMAIPNPRARQYSWPAQRTDGSGPPNAIPEGARFRLPANLDLSALHLPKFTLMMARAAKHYGIFVRDRGGGVGFFAQDPAGMHPDPYYGPHGLFHGRQPNQLLARFPWRKLRVLKMSLCTNQTRICRRR